MTDEFIACHNMLLCICHLSVARFDGLLHSIINVYPRDVLRSVKIVLMMIQAVCCFHVVCRPLL